MCSVSITVTVNYNSDDVQIRIQKDDKEEVISLPCKNPHQVKSIIEEVLNAVYNPDVIETTLEVVNEDTVKRIDTW